MDYASKLARLEHLRDLVDQYSSMISAEDDKVKRKQLHQEICETYGEVADVFDQVVGKQRIEVPSHGISGIKGFGSQYPNYFEAGFLSGRTIHTHQGRTELLKVIGKVKTLVNCTPEFGQSG